MPRQIAFLLCSIFVLCLLRYDRKKSTNVSWALWLPTLWMLCTASRPLDTWLAVGGGSREGGGVVDPIFQTVLLCLGLIILSRRQLNWSVVIRDNQWLVILIGYMLVSIVWSNSPFICFKRWVRELTAVIMALLILVEPDPRQALESFLKRIVYVLIPFSVLVIKYYQDIGVGYSPWTGEIQWTGVTLQKNGLGRLCLTAAFVLIWILRRRWKKTDPAASKYETGAEIILLIMTAWLLRGPSMWAASATAIYALATGFAVFFVLLWMRKHRVPSGTGIWVAIVAAIIVFGVITPFVGGSTVAAFTSAVERNTTLTGRTEIWAGLLPDFMRRPILGYGFGGFWTLRMILAHRIGEAHNGYLEVLLGTGIVGLFLTAMFLISSARRSAALLSYDYDFGALGICFVIMTAVHNITESSLDSFGRYMMTNILFVAVAITASAVRRPTLPATLNQPVPAMGFAPAEFNAGISPASVSPPSRIG